MRRIAALSVAASALVSSLFAADFSLVGKSGAAMIVIAENAEESSKLAAEELTNYVFRISGKQAKLEIEGEGQGLSAPATRGASGTVRIGTLGKFPGPVPAEAVEALGKTTNLEASWTGVRDGTLWIVGKDEVAELYATYHFLESKLGIRWFQAPTAEDPGDYVPTRETIVLGTFAEFREPKFRIRRLDNCAVYGGTVATQGMATAVRNGYQVYPVYGAPVPYDKPQSEICRFFAPRLPRRAVALGGGHLTFVSPVPAKTYFKDHPEYFALVDGVRQEKTHQYCFSNPDVQRLTADYVIRGLERHGGLGSFLFGMVDVTHGWCECENCRALDPVAANGTTTPNVSTRFNLAVKNMADMIWAKWPKADLRLWAYHTYRELPIGVRQDPKMMVQFCDHGRCYGHRFDDPNCVRNADMLKLMKGWLEVTPQVFTYEYFVCTPPRYVCHERDEAHDLRFYASLGVMGWKNEASFTGSRFIGRRENDDRPDIFPSNWQWLYTTGKLLWDPDQDENAILADAESKYYGVAYPAMKKYHALRRKLWEGNRNCMGYPTSDARTATLLNVSGAKEELLACLDEADRLATDPVVKRRVGLDRKWLVKYWIEANEDQKKRAGKAYRAPRAAQPPVVDGKGGDDAWAGAFYLDAFASLSGRHKPIPEELATSVGILHDGKNLYFLVRAKEPSDPKVLLPKSKNAWAGEGFEFLLKPPSADNIVYHFGVTPRGDVWASTDRRGVEADAFGLTAAGTEGPDGWTLEVKLPVKRIYALTEGETWTALFGRNRASRQGVAEGDHWTSEEGRHYADTPSFRPLEIGLTYLKNGSFVDLDEKGQPKGWSILGAGSKMLKPGGLFLKGSVVQTMWHGALRQQDRPRKLSYSFAAKGSGKVSVSFYRYVDTPNPKAKHGYDRKYDPKPLPGAVFSLTDEMGTYSGEHTVPAGEWNSISLFSNDGVTIQSVSVTPTNQ